MSTTSSMQEKIQKFATAIQQNTVINTISGSMTALMPVLMAGAVCSLITGLPLGDGYTNFLRSTGIQSLLSDITSLSQLMALFCSITIGAGIGRLYNEDQVISGVMGLLAFLICTPLFVTGNDGTAVTGAINTSYLGSQGMFAALIAGGLGSWIYCKLMSMNLKIKLPDSVPPFVSRSFEGIIPGICMVAVFAVIRAVFAATPWGNFNDAVYSIVQAPLTGLGSNLPAMLIFIFLTSFFWWFGLHGTLVVLTFAFVYYPQMLTNLEAYMAGTPLAPSQVVVLSYMFWFLFIQFFGGPGMLLGLDINMVLFSKSERYKALGKIALVPGFFNIIEPVVYGFPIVMNPILFIPFCFGPVIWAAIGYFLMVGGIVGYPVVMLNVMTIPAPVAGFLLGGGISLGLFVLVGIVYSVLIYIPFFRAADNAALKEEQAIAAEKANA